MSAIISIDDLNSYLNKSLTPAIAQQVVDAVNAYIKRMTGRCWGEIRTATERSDFRIVTYLRHQDVVSITSVRSGAPGETQTIIDTAAYYVNPLGRLTFGTYRYNPYYASVDALEVTYTYGVIDVPEVLRLAALGLAASFYNWASGGQRQVTASQVGTYRVHYTGSGTRGSGEDTTADANRSIIAAYAMKRV